MYRTPCILTFSVCEPLRRWAESGAATVLIPSQQVPPLELVWRGTIGHVGWQPDSPDEQAYLFAQICALNPACLWLWDSPNLGFLSAYAARFLGIPALATPDNPEDVWGQVYATGDVPVGADVAWFTACLAAVQRT